MKTSNILSLLALATFAAALPHPELPSRNKTETSGPSSAGIPGHIQPGPVDPVLPGSKPLPTQGAASQDPGSITPISTTPQETSSSPTSGASPAESSGFDL